MCLRIGKDAHWLFMPISFIGLKLPLTYFKTTSNSNRIITLKILNEIDKKIM